MATNYKPTTQQDYDYYKSKIDNSYRGGDGKTYTTFQIEQMDKEKAGWRAEAARLWKQLQTEKDAAWKVDPSNPEVKSEDAWKEAMGLLQREGPMNEAWASRQASRYGDQTAAAEAVNAEEIRNQAAARGMDPTQAIRGLQQGRQAQNVAFSGDIASQAAVQNFAAETPGRMAAAQANLARQFGGATQPAVTGGGINMGGGMPMPQAAPRQQTAFSSGGTPAPAPAPKPVIAPTPQRQPMSVADRNAAQAAWVASGGKTINGTKPGSVGPTSAANAITKTPAQQTAYQSLLNSPSTAVYRQPGVPSNFGGPTPAAKINTAFNPFK
jgi:hypothetical protein